MYDEIVVVDVDDFGGNATPAGLETALRRAGARTPEVTFFSTLLSGAARTLPSLDDALASVYDHYLAPTDLALAGAGINFLRHRDEYIVFRSEDARRVGAALGAQGLSARTVYQARVTELMSELQGEADAAEDHAAYREFPVLDGEVTASWVCGAVWPCSDAFELHYRRDPDSAALPTVFTGTPREIADGVRVLPLLRNAHRQRTGGVLDTPPFARSTAAFLSHARAVSSARSWLRAHLRLAVAAGSTHAVVWTCQLLSDLTLAPDEVTDLRTAATSIALSERARQAAAVALARSSALREEDFWFAPEGGDEWSLRAAMLGAGYLFRRGRRAVADGLAARAGGQPWLLELLRTEGMWP